MGWTVELEFRTRKQFIAHLVAPWTSKEWQESGGTKGVSSVCLKHVYRGAPHKGVLYSLHENTYADGRKVKFAVVWLIQLFRPDGWGYKDMEASMGPYYHAFPLSWLEGIDESGYAKEWIERVKKYWEDRKQAQRERRVLRARRMACAHIATAAGDRKL